jgi:hypothetical protein
MVRLISAKRCELQFFRRYCGAFCARKRLELAFRLDFLFLFHQGKRKRKNANVFYKTLPLTNQNQPVTKSASFFDKNSQYL